jgi:hypothetical protein
MHVRLFLCVHLKMYVFVNVYIDEHEAHCPKAVPPTHNEGSV